MSFYIFFVCMYILAGISSYFIIWENCQGMGKKKTLKVFMFILCLIAWPVCILTFLELMINRFIDNYVENSYMDPKTRDKSE